MHRFYHSGIDTPALPHAADNRSLQTQTACDARMVCRACILEPASYLRCAAPASSCRARRREYSAKPCSRLEPWFCSQRPTCTCRLFRMGWMREDAGAPPSISPVRCAGYTETVCTLKCARRSAHSRAPSCSWRWQAPRPAIPRARARTQLSHQRPRRRARAHRLRCGCSSRVSFRRARC